MDHIVYDAEVVLWILILEKTVRKFNIFLIYTSILHEYCIKQAQPCLLVTLSSYSHMFACKFGMHIYIDTHVFSWLLTVSLPCLAVAHTHHTDRHACAEYIV